MTFDEKALIALYDLLSEGTPVTKRSLCRRMGLSRCSIYNRLKKHNRFIDVENLDTPKLLESRNV